MDSGIMTQTPSRRPVALPDPGVYQSRLQSALNRSVEKGVVQANGWTPRQEITMAMDAAGRSDGAKGRIYQTAKAGAIAAATVANPAVGQALRVADQAGVVDRVVDLAQQAPATMRAALNDGVQNLEGIQEFNGVFGGGSQAESMMAISGFKREAFAGIKERLPFDPEHLDDLSPDDHMRPR